jgi:xanthine dehydrogenase accessory factor
VSPGIYETLADSIRSESPVALAEVVEGPVSLLGSKLLVRPGPPPQVLGSLGDPDLDRVVTRDVLGELAAGLTATRHYGLHGEARARDVSVFIESFAPPPRMIIFGAVDFTAALAKVAKVLGYRVTVCDARPVFATRARFPMADDVVVSWPDRYLAEVGADLGPRDAVCVLTHDPKFDVPAIVAALETEVGYLGAMGSRKTTDDRVERLRAAGVSGAGLSRVMGPIGLDIGARTPEETAVAICAEIISMRTGRSAPSLRDASGPIHRDLAAAEGTA